MNSKNKKPSFYYITGAIVLTIGVVMLITSFTLPLIDKEKSYLGYIAMGLTIISLVVLFYSLYLLKKGNFLKRNRIKDSSKDYEEELKKKLDDKEKELNSDQDK